MKRFAAKFADGAVKPGKGLEPADEADLQAQGPRREGQDDEAQGPREVTRRSAGTVRRVSDSRATTEAGPSLDEIVALCKRRGFIFPSSEIYGGVGSTYDYGHYGVLLKNNVKDEWWRSMLQERDDIVAIDSAIIQHPRVWEASGHLAGFTDPMVDCKTCKLRFRADKLEDGAVRPEALEEGRARGRTAS